MRAFVAARPLTALRAGALGWPTPALARVVSAAAIEDTNGGEEATAGGAGVAAAVVALIGTFGRSLGVPSLQTSTVSPPPPKLNELASPLAVGAECEQRTEAALAAKPSPGLLSLAPASAEELVSRGLAGMPPYSSSPPLSSAFPASMGQ